MCFSYQTVIFYQCKNWEIIVLYYPFYHPNVPGSLCWTVSAAADAGYRGLKFLVLRLAAILDFLFNKNAQGWELQSLSGVVLGVLSLKNLQRKNVTNQNMVSPIMLLTRETCDQWCFRQWLSEISLVCVTASSWIITENTGQKLEKDTCYYA